eukprot:5596772-Amphidinium_carterae.1
MAPGMASEVASVSMVMILPLRALSIRCKMPGLALRAKLRMKSQGVLGVRPDLGDVSEVRSSFA